MSKPRSYGVAWLKSFLTIGLMTASIFSVISPQVEALTSRGPIVIRGNADFTPENGVTGGSGTALDPYIIEGWFVDGDWARVEIVGTDAWFTLRNVEVRASASFAIGLFSVSNGRIENAKAQNPLHEGGKGVHLSFSRNINISDTTSHAGCYMCNAYGDGLVIESSTDVVLTNFETFNNGMGVIIRDSNRVRIEDSRVNSYLGYEGLVLDGSTDVTLSRNVLASLVVYGSREQLRSYTITPDNMVTGYGSARPLYYYKDCSGLDIDGVALGQLIMVNCTDIRVASLQLSLVHTGIHLAFVDGATIYNNTISGTAEYRYFWYADGIRLTDTSRVTISGNHVSLFAGEGIEVAHSTFTTIFGNNIYDNYFGTGLFLDRSNNALVYHNNLFNSNTQASDTSFANSWDNDYPDGGNYWGLDYSGTDQCSGLSQDVCTGPDGIGDAPQPVPPNGNDRYPLIRAADTSRDVVPPSTPQAATAVATEPNQVDIGWQASTDNVGVTAYEIYRGAPRAGLFRIASVEGSLTEYSDKSVSPSTSYYYYVVAFDAAGNRSPQSNNAWVTTPALPPDCSRTLIFNPTDDAYTMAGTTSGNGNFGKDPQLIVDSSPLRNFLLKFSVTGVETCYVSGAKLRLFQTDSSNRGGDFRTITPNWSEDTVTWNNAPAAGPSVIASLGSVSAGRWYEVDIMSAVTGDGIVSLRVTSSSSDGAFYSSKEGANPPQLVVTLSSTRPPTTSLLTFTPTDDAYIMPYSSSDSNFGSDPRLIVDASPRRDFLLKFTVTGVETGLVLSAKLRLFQADSSPRGGDFCSTSTGWSEGTVSWNNAPACQTTAIASLGSVSANTWYEVDVTGVVTGDGTVSFRISSPNSDGAFYSSKEGANPPLLVITVSG